MFKLRGKQEKAIATLIDCGYEIVDVFYTAGLLELPTQSIKSKIEFNDGAEIEYLLINGQKSNQEDFVRVKYLETLTIEMKIKLKKNIIIQTALLMWIILLEVCF